MKKRAPQKQGPARRTGSISTNPVRTDWDHVGEWYDELVGDQGSVHHEQVIIPGVLRLIDPHPGKRILDIACGQGVACRALAGRGAATVGMDLAPSLIEAARRRTASPELESYYVGDARHLENSPLAPASFDAAICILAIANMTPLSPIWKGCFHLLKPGGRLVVVLLHPCFRIPKKSDWGWDDRDQLQYRRVDSYLTSEKIPIQTHPGQDPGQETFTFHRPLQAYINTLGSAGLLLERLEEWISRKTPPAGRRFAGLDASRREIPLFLALCARKV